jgi:bifunctional NMN adenylyltransferase/nudix hydrolase
MKNKYDVAVVIGRFEPFHNLHYKLVKKALELGDEILIVLGSAKAAPDPRNPFTAPTREAMIRSCFPSSEARRLHFKGVRDHIYNYDIWLAEVQNIVRDFQEQIMDERGIDYDTDTLHFKISNIKVALVGHLKDSTSDYLKRFPQWTFEPYYVNAKESEELSATDIRNLYFEGDRYEQFVPQPVASFMRSFASTEPYRWLKAEYNYIKQYRNDSRFVGLPYEPTFLTTDAVVTCNGHIVLVRRGFNPGRGLLALPGGFLHPDLSIADNAVKELREETKIRIDQKTLAKSVCATHVFDFPLRSLRGRTITHAFHFKLDVDGDLPSISRKGGDDASGALWIPISALPDYEEEFFEDHYQIIKYFIRGEAIRGEEPKAFLQE